VLGLSVPSRYEERKRMSGSKESCASRTEGQEEFQEGLFSLADIRETGFSEVGGNQPPMCLTGTEC